MEKVSRGKEGDWEKKRREVLERAGMSKKQIRRVRETEDQDITEDLMKRLERRGKEERQIKINESRYNSNYKNIRLEKLPKYLEGKKRKEV